MGDQKPIWETFEMVPCRALKPKHTVRHFQQYATYLSLSQSNFVIGLQTGLGKTLVAYLSYHFYKEKYPNVKLIFVSNKSAILQMEEQLYKFFHVESTGIAIHNYMDKLKKEKYKDTRKRIIDSFGEIEDPDSPDILWMSYATFRINRGNVEQSILKLRKKGYHIFTIYDESTSFMNMNTQIYRAVSKVSRLSNKVCALTATLSKGKLEQIYAIFKALNIQIFSTKKFFEDRYCIIWQHPKHFYIRVIKGYQNVQELVEMIRPYIVVLRKADVADELPPFTIKKTYLEHSEEQIKFISGIYTGDIDVSAYKMEGNSLRMEDKEGNRLKALKAAIETNFIKTALLDERLVGRKKVIDPKKLSPKTEELIRMMEEDFIDEKLIVYSHSRQYLELMYESFKKSTKVPLFYRKNILKIHGGVNSRDREKNKNLFSETNNHNIMLINNAGIESINLQASNTIILTTLPFDFGSLTQLAGRISRLDTIHSKLFLIYLLMKDSQDEDEYQIIMQQGVLMKNLFDEAEEGLLDYSVLIKDSNISKEEYQTRSLSSLVFKARKRRARKYLTMMKGLK